VKIFRNPWFWLAVLGLGGIALVWWLHVRFPDALSSRDGRIDLVHTVLILAFVGSSFVLHRRFKAHDIVRHAAVWLGIGGLVFIGYSFRYEAKWLGSRLLGDLVPSLGEVQGDAMRYPASDNGHFIVEVTVTTDTARIPIRFLVDTGATLIAMNKHDAKRIGLNYRLEAEQGSTYTASGIDPVYLMKLDKVKVGDIELRDVDASVHDGDHPHVILLGNSFLGKLDLQREGKILKLLK